MVTDKSSENQAEPHSFLPTANGKSFLGAARPCLAEAFLDLTSRNLSLVDNLVCLLWMDVLSLAWGSLPIVNLTGS